MKRCTKCKQEKPFAEFYKAKNYRDGYNSRCKKCLSEWHSRNFIANRERILAEHKNYREQNPERVSEIVRASARKHYQRNAERLRVESREQYYRDIDKSRARARADSAKRRAEGKIDKEKNRAYQAAYRERHREAINERHKKHVEANKDRIRLRMANVKAQRRMAEGRVTTREWKAILLFYGNSCGLCKISGAELPMTVDHFIPLARGGTNTWDNVWPLCMPCNIKKHAQIPNAKYPPHVEIFQKTGTLG